MIFKFFYVYLIMIPVIYGVQGYTPQEMYQQAIKKYSEQLAKKELILIITESLDSTAIRCNPYSVSDEKRTPMPHADTWSTLRKSLKFGSFTADVLLQTRLENALRTFAEEVTPTYYGQICMRDKKAILVSSSIQREPLEDIRRAVSTFKCHPVKEDQIIIPTQV